MKKMKILMILAVGIGLCSTLQARWDDDETIDDLNVGDVIILKFGVPEDSPNKIPALAKKYLDYINLGEMRVTIIEKGVDTGLTLSQEEKTKILEVAIDWAKNACEMGVPWEAIDGHRGGFPTKAYHYAYRKIVLGQQDAPYNYEEVRMSRNLPNMEFGEYVNAPAEPPAGSEVLPGGSMSSTSSRCRVGLGIGNGLVAAGQKEARFFHYTRIAQFDRRGYGGYRMPTFRYFFYFDPYIIYKNKKGKSEIYQPLGWRKVNKPDWDEFPDMRGGINWKQRFSFPPGTVIKHEFFPSRGLDCSEWGKGSYFVTMDCDQGVNIEVWKK